MIRKNLITEGNNIKSKHILMFEDPLGSNKATL